THADLHRHACESNAQRPRVRSEGSRRLPWWLAGCVEEPEKFYRIRNRRILMATTAVLPEQNIVQGEVFIAAPPARVFEAITDPKQVPRWWGQQGMYRITEWKGDVRRGGKWSSVGLSQDGSTFRVDGEYLEVDPPRLLVHTWIASW